MSQQAFFELPDADGDDLYKQAMGKAGRILARRPHSRREIVDKLGKTYSEVSDRVLERLDELGLVDDEEFAGRWVQERSARKGKVALLQELHMKGVDRELAEAAVATVEDQQIERAHELAAKYLRRVSGKPPERQAAAIQQMLVRRGYPFEVAEEAARKVLPPEGWD